MCPQTVYTVLSSALQRPARPVTPQLCCSDSGSVVSTQGHWENSSSDAPATWDPRILQPHASVTPHATLCYAPMPLVNPHVTLCYAPMPPVNLHATLCRDVPFTQHRGCWEQTHLKSRFGRQFEGGAMRLLGHWPRARHFELYFHAVGGASWAASAWACGVWRVVCGDPLRGDPLRTILQPCLFLAAHITGCH